MGIPHLFKWLKNKNYRGVLRRSVPQYVSSFSFDFNGVLHAVAQTVYAYGSGEDPKRKKLVEQADPKMLEAEYYQALATKLTEIITQVAPQEILVLAVDGVAPQAKISQQRRRRFRSAMESSGNSVFDSNALTPGTEFMKRVDNFIQRWLISSAKTLPPKVIYSSHMVEGEGEHKILSLMRNGEISGDGYHIIYGMDADLIMLSLMAPLEKISLMREDISSIIDINTLKSALKDELELESSISDFVVMIFLLGNDFLPHLVSLADLDESIETMMDVYKRNKLSLTENGDINWPGLTNYLKALANEEPRLLERESKRNVKYPSRMMSLATQTTEIVNIGKVEKSSKFDNVIFRNAWYENAFNLKAEKDVFQKLLPNHNFRSSKSKIIKMVKDYLTGISWVYRYYHLGKEFINNDYVYRYHYGPLLLDMSIVAANIGKTFNIENYKFNPNAIIINPVHQLLAVIPLKSKKLLPYEVEHLSRKDSPIADYFPEIEVIERDGMNTDWQGVILINFVDMKRILQSVETTSLFTEERIKEFSPTYNIVLKRDLEIAQLDERTKKFKEYLSKETGRNKSQGYQRQPYNPQNKSQGYQRQPYNPQNKSQGRGYNPQNKSQGRGYNPQNKSQGQPNKSQVYRKKQDLPPLPTVNIPKPLEVQKFEL